MCFDMLFEPSAWWRWVVAGADECVMWGWLVFWALTSCKMRRLRLEPSLQSKTKVNKNTILKKHAFVFWALTNVRYG